MASEPEVDPTAVARLNREISHHVRVGNHLTAARIAIELAGVHRDLGEPGSEVAALNASANQFRKAAKVLYGGKGERADRMEEEARAANMGAAAVCKREAQSCAGRGEHHDAAMAWSKRAQQLKLAGHPWRARWAEGSARKAEGRARPKRRRR